MLSSISFTISILSVHLIILMYRPSLRMDRKVKQRICMQKKQESSWIFVRRQKLANCVRTWKETFMEQAAPFAFVMPLLRLTMENGWLGNGGLTSWTRQSF